MNRYKKNVLEDWKARYAAVTSLTAFSRYVDENYQTPPHLIMLDDMLEACEQREITRLIVTMPPQHGKSSKISVKFPAWYLGRNPTHKVVQATYAENLSLKHSKKCKECIAQPEYRAIFPGVTERKVRGETLKKRIDFESAKEWSTIQGGEYYAVGVGGGLTGRGFDLGIIDDPIKDAEEARSQVVRENIMDWYRSVFSTRPAPNAVVIIVMTRWHEYDLVGQVLEESGEKWTVLHLPAFAEDDDQLGREIGAPLWPERYNKEWLEEQRDDIGPYWWNALYCCRPVPEGGTVFKFDRFQYYAEDETLPTMRTVQVWDTAFKDKQRNDRNACVTVAETPYGYYVLDCFAKRMQYPELLKMARAYCLKYPDASVGAEDKATGTPLIQQLKRELIPMVAIKAQGDKITRAHAVSGIVDAGMVYLPQNAPWLADFLAEVTGFPNAKHDDIVDAFVYCLTWLKAKVFVDVGRKSEIKRKESVSAKYG